jgi:hypothetical protein
MLNTYNSAYAALFKVTAQARSGGRRPRGRGRKPRERERERGREQDNTPATTASLLRLTSYIKLVKKEI